MRATLITFAVLMFLLAIALLSDPAGRGGPSPANAQAPAAECCTQYGRCPLTSPTFQGQPCVCRTPIGPVGGFGC